MKVTLREKKLKKGKRSLYLDFYPPIIADGVQTRREFLSLYVYDKPKTEDEREHNKETRLLGQNIRSKRQLDLQANPHGFVSRRRRNSSFFDYLKKQITRRQKRSQSDLETWQSVIIHLTDFTGGACTFAQIDKDFVERFREYLLNCEPLKTKASKLLANSRSKSTKKTLSQNTAKIYFERFVSVVREAREENYLTSDPSVKVETIKRTTPQRDFLTIEEFQTLAQTECDIPDTIRRAALFSTLTGLRHSDIVNLTWGMVRDGKNGAALYFRIKKTEEPSLNPISDEARELLGKRESADAQVFTGLRYETMTNVYIERWTKAASIERRITFHAFGRTFATAQITLGTSLYTVQQMLGHADPRQTQIYAKLLDETKRTAANRITLK